MNLMESLMAQGFSSSSGGSNLTPEVKEALLDCFANVAWANDDGQQYYDALQDALHGLQSISAVYTQSGTVYETDSLDSLKADLVVTALYGDGSTQTVPAESYTLSGTLTEGTSTITVSYGGKTATFEVVVTIPYVYKMSTGEIVKITGTMAGAIGGQNYITSNGYRRVFALRDGKIKLKEESSGTYVDSEYYPFPVPSNAVRVAVSITPNTQFFNVTYDVYNTESAMYIKTAETGWKQGSFDYSIPSGENRFIALNSKYNSAGTSYPTEPTELVVQFYDE